MRFLVVLVVIGFAGCARPVATLSPPRPEPPETPDSSIRPLTLEQDEQLADQEAGQPPGL